MSQVWWIDGLVAAEDARLAVHARGVQYGLGCYETVRVYEGGAFRLAAHLERFAASARTLGLAPCDAAVAEAAVAATCAANHLRDAAVRLSLYASGEVAAPPLGAGGTERAGGEASALHVAAHAPADWSQFHAVGAIAITVPEVRRDPRSPLSGVKVTAAPLSLAARAAAARAGADEALLCTVDGRLSEFSAANLFFVRGGVLCTPSLDCGCLGGVTRTVVLECAQALGLPVQEGHFELATLRDADECLMTGSVREVVPIIQLDGAAIGRGTPGPVTRELQVAYAARVAAETR